MNAMLQTVQERGPAAGPEDQELIVRLRSRDQAALESLMRKYSSQVVGAAYRVLHHRPDAEEVAQDVFWALWRSPERFDERRGQLLTWLLIVARSRALDRSRRLYQHAIHEQKMTCAETTPDVSVLATEKDRELMVRELLDRLPSEQHWLVRKTYFEGYALSEIATMRSLPLGTVKGRARFAIKRLRAGLEAQR